MLKGEFTFIRSNRLQGTNKNGNEYDFANLTVSDGLESYDMTLQLDVHESTKHLRKGDTITVEVEVSGRRGNANYEVAKVYKSANKVTA